MALKSILTQTGTVQVELDTQGHWL